MCENKEWMLPTCKPGSVEPSLVTVISLGAWSPTPSSSLPAASWSGRAVPRCLFGLAPAGVCHATGVTTCAVSSYLTVSPLPVLGEPSHRRSFLCCTFRRDKRLAQVLPGNVPYEARTFLEHLRARDHPADSIRLER